MNKRKKIEKKDIFEALIIGFLFSVLVLFVYKIGRNTDFFFYNNEEGITLKKTIELFRQYTKISFFVGLIGSWAFFTFAYIFLNNINKKYFDIIYKYRYAIALLLLGIGVFFEISGSSISSLCGALGVDVEQSGLMFRVANPYRSDEFGLNTIFAIAQEKNLDDSYPYISNIVRGTSTDMYIVYGQPVKDIGILFRPFHWGYLLFGSEKGLAFFWCGRLIFLFMVSFEFGRLFLKNRKKLAVVYAVFIAMSPVLQWWFAINGLAEMLIFGQLCSIMLYLFMRTASVWKGMIYSFVFFWSGCVYILLFYPAWQVVFGYAYLGVFVWIIIENRKQFIWKGKADIISILIPALCCGGILLFLIYRSWDTIQSVMNTVYPGNRIDTNKLEIWKILCGTYNMYLPLTDSQMVIPWGFIDLFPLNIILAGYVLFKKRKKDGMLIIMLAIDLILIVFFTLPVPEILMKVTLLSLTTCDRALIGIQFLNIIVLFRSVSLLDDGIKSGRVIVAAIIYAFAVVMIFSETVDSIPLSLIMKVGMFLAMCIFSFLLCNSHKEKESRILISFTIMVFLVAGGLVNPIQKGLSMVERSNILGEITEIVEEDNEAKWISVDLPYPETNISLLAGASTINSTNVYPTLERWEMLDPDGVYTDVYNRYAHITINLKVDEKTEFELVAPDHFLINLNVNDLEKLEVKYILSREDLTSYSNDNVLIENIKKVDGYFIYEINYL
ncbi:hypothetical protein INF30_06615 [Lachnospiraceae bacterium DSM 108991]|uniref:Glycosyltransferase RgtA/B/C/D-like domain-containing protein n=1 Tax=Claveliimonas monacensis TaxID=2779351 RepID=A0ABR9RJ14_9FIRM|nr:hypothetical protein [Claveliimonas monacensis]MBE5062931.1 hypothetical protein [Claveliimonas monacensis]